MIVLVVASIALLSFGPVVSGPNWVEALADDVPLEIDGACCFNHEAKLARKPG